MILHVRLSSKFRSVGIVLGHIPFREYRIMVGNQNKCRMFEHSVATFEERSSSSIWQYICVIILDILKDHRYFQDSYLIWIIFWSLEINNYHPNILICYIFFSSS